MATQANWVMPPFDETYESYDGTVCLSKATFLDEFLLPRLARFNSESTWVVDEAWWKSEGLGLTNSWGVSGHLGLTSKDLQNDHFKDYQWKLSSSVDGTRKYEYKKTHRIDDDKGLWRVYQEGGTTNSLTIPEGLDSSGKSVMKFSGTTEVKTYTHLDGIGDLGKISCSVTCVWEASIILDGVNDGALKITVDNSKTTLTKNAESYKYPHILNGTVARCEKIFENSSFYDIKAGLEALFEGSWSFVFSQGRDFYIDKACFNREGDLMCQLKYKSAGV